MTIHEPIENATESPAVQPIEDPVVELLARLRDEYGTGAGDTDPAWALASALLAQRSAEGQADEQLDERDARCDELEGAVASLEAALQVLQRRNIRLASALGACHDCWGSDAGCTRCAGAGRPGTFPPNPGWFERLVAPSLRWFPGMGEPPNLVSDRSNG